MKQWRAWALIVALFAVAIALFARQAVISSRENAPVKAKSPEEQIALIQNDPNMPEQAKAIAIGQIRARAGGPNVEKPAGVKP